MIVNKNDLVHPQSSDPLAVREVVLSNGLTVWLNEDHSQPKVFGAVVVKAGAKDSPNTGIAHYFEHIMFKGTDKIGTIDYEKEKVILEAISDKYDELAETEDEEERANIQNAINILSIEAAKYVIPNEFDQLISKFGGTKLNAGTSYDYTVYYNTFSPQYIRQWAIINSDRLINPVFRLFQSELETVYEEKNMYNDKVGAQAIQKLTERYFLPHPYAFPIVGSTEHLKNPRLSEMRRFFETYYVASNMGLILSGDIDSAAILPLLEETFGKIRDGKLPVKEKIVLPKFKKREKYQIKVPIPFVRVFVLGFRGVPANHTDEIPLKIAMSLLNNSNGTGFLDKLTVDRKILSSMAMSESLNEEGILAVVGVPKLVFQSYGKAEKLVWKAISRIKKGDFSNEVFQSLKLEQKREYESSLEDISSRAEIMMRVFSQGKSWQEYLNEVARIDKLTREDIVEVANKYFTDNYLYASKKTGRYPKDNLSKPNYKPVIPENKSERSRFAQELEKLKVENTVPKLIDFEKDVETITYKPQVTLYKTPNRVNQIFTLKIAFGIGTTEMPLLSHLASYLSFVGTSSYSFEEFRNRLQTLGSTLMFEATESDFNILVKGVDQHFDKTMELVGQFMSRAAVDDKKMKQVVDDAKVMDKTFFQSSDHLAMALYEKMRYGSFSRYLRKLSFKEIKKLRSRDLIKTFATIQNTECNIHYCGTLSVEDVMRHLDKHIPLQEERVESQSPFYREKLSYDKPTILFYDMPDVAQSIIYGYLKSDGEIQERDRYVSRLFSAYLGGDMSSLMFQEIREFRSYAYRVSARYHLSLAKYKHKPGDLMVMLSTQVDKTTDALLVLHSLLKDMPVRPEKVGQIKQSFINNINNEYPSFRDISTRIAHNKRNGYAEDPNRLFLDHLKDMDINDIMEFYNRYVKESSVVYAIVGNSRQIDMARLSEYGEVVKIKKKDIYH